MDSYIVRVVLHHTDSSNDYTDLHAEMAKQEFKQTITGKDDNGKEEVCDLPGGMYSLLENNTTVKEVHARASKAVAEVMKDEKASVKAANKPASVFVAQTTALRWTGLPFKK